MGGGGFTANASRRSVLSSRMRGELERYLAASGSLKLWGHICYLSVLVTLNEVLYRIVCDEITDEDVARVNGNVAFVWDTFMAKKVDLARVSEDCGDWAVWFQSCNLVAPRPLFFVSGGGGWLASAYRDLSDCKNHQLYIRDLAFFYATQGSGGAASGPNSGQIWEKICKKAFPSSA
ncbi:unnamed protein product [Symbiodinium sp. CCMP2592]|nr:unnamed protein product [Symbiodinium sp. CCMP2592]